MRKKKHDQLHHPLTVDGTRSYLSLFLNETIYRKAFFHGTVGVSEWWMVIIHYYILPRRWCFSFSFIRAFSLPSTTRLSILFYFFFCYLHEEDADDESRSLAVAHLAIMQRVGFHDVEEAFLTQAIFLFEEVVFGVRARYVATDDLSFFRKDVILLSYHPQIHHRIEEATKEMIKKKDEKHVWNLFTGGCGFDILGVLRLGRGVVGAAQQWPDDAPEMMRDPFADKVFDVGVSLLVRIGPIGHQTAPKAPLIFFVVVWTRLLTVGTGTCRVSRNSNIHTFQKK